MPAPGKLRSTSACTVLAPAVMVRPLPPATLPSTSTSGVPANSGWVVPSMVTGSVIVGRVVSSWIVCAPPPMSKSMMSGPVFALASTMACLNEPAPASSVFSTVNVVKSVRSSSDSQHKRRAAGLVRAPARLAARVLNRGFRLEGSENIIGSSWSRWVCVRIK